MSAQPLKDRVCVVTGAASGIGRAAATLLASRGATVIVLDRDEAGVGRVVEELNAAGGSAHGQVFDLMNSAVIPDLVDRIYQAHQHIDVLINCAGYRGKHQPLGSVELDIWEQTLGINLTAPMLLIQCVAPRMADRGAGGKIVNISSGAGQVAGYAPAYSCSKAALNQLTRSAAGRYGRHGINVNAVAPGLVETPGLETVENLEREVQPGGRMANLLRKVTQPEDVAELIVFLSSETSNHITGQTIHINAGSLVV